MNGFQIDAVNNALDEDKAEVKRLKAEIEQTDLAIAGMAVMLSKSEAMVKRLANALGSALLFSDAAMLELLINVRDNGRPLPMHLIANQQSLDASMKKLLTEVLGPQHPPHPDLQPKKVTEP